jgi:hypothetical protein
MIAAPLEKAWRRGGVEAGRRGGGEAWRRGGGEMVLQGPTSSSAVIDILILIFL